MTQPPAVVVAPVVSPSVRPATAALVRAALWVGVLLAMAWFMMKIQFTLVVFGLAWLIAYLLNSPVRVLETGRSGLRKLSRGRAVAFIYLMLLLLLALAGSLIFPQVADQVAHLVQLQSAIAHPQDLANLVKARGAELLERVPVQYRQELLDRLNSSLGTISSQIGAWIVIGINYLASFIGQMVTGLFVLLSAMLVSIYMLLNWTQMREGFVEVFPRNYRGEVRDLMAKLNAIFGGYVKATILLSGTVSICSGLAVMVVSLIFGLSSPYMLVIALVAGLTFPIPIFGILSSTVLAGVLSFLPTSDLGYALTVAGTVCVINNIIDRTLQPLLMSGAIGVSPLFVMFAAAAGGEFMGGVWGMLAGIPLAAMGKALFSWFHGRFLLVPDEVAPNAIDLNTPLPIGAPPEPPPPPMEAPEIVVPEVKVVEVKAPEVKVVEAKAVEAEAPAPPAKAPETPPPDPPKKKK